MNLGGGGIEPSALIRAAMGEPETSAAQVEHDGSVRLLDGQRHRQRLADLDSDCLAGGHLDRAGCLADDELTLALALFRVIRDLCTRLPAERRACRCRSPSNGTSCR